MGATSSGAMLRVGRRRPRRWPGHAMRVIAAGASALTLMPFLAPATARLRVSPMTPPLAAAYERFAGKPENAGRGGHDDAAVALRDEVRPGGACGVERPADVHRKMLREVVGVGVGKPGPANDSGVVDEDVDPPEAFQCRADERVGTLDRRHVMAVGDRRASRARRSARRRTRRARHRRRSPAIEPPRSLTTTLAPRSASSMAWARPMPRPAPVTTATRPSNVSGSGAVSENPGEGPAEHRGALVVRDAGELPGDQLTAAAESAFGVRVVVAPHDRRHPADVAAGDGDRIVLERHVELALARTRSASADTAISRSAGRAAPCSG